MARRIESLSLAGPVGGLEALLEEPDDREPRLAAVLCHPHPLYGGTMHNKVVYRIARGLRRAGCVVLRFNFRGVGRSEGGHGHMAGEIEDARAALGYLRARYPELPFALAGFSFGSRAIMQLGCEMSCATAREAGGGADGAIARNADGAMGRDAGGATARDAGGATAREAGATMAHKSDGAMGRDADGAIDREAGSAMVDEARVATTHEADGAMAHEAGRATTREADGPIGRAQFLLAAGFATRMGPVDFLAECAVPKIFIHSTHDEFGPRPDFERMYLKVAEPKRLIWIEAADHFFAGALEELEERVKEAACAVPVAAS